MIIDSSYNYHCWQPVAPTGMREMRLSFISASYRWFHQVSTALDKQQSASKIGRKWHPKHPWIVRKTNTTAPSMGPSARHERRPRAGRGGVGVDEEWRGCAPDPQARAKIRLRKTKAVESADWFRLHRNVSITVRMEETRITCSGICLGGSNHSEELWFHLHAGEKKKKKRKYPLPIQ